MLSLMTLWAAARRSPPPYAAKVVLSGRLRPRRTSTPSVPQRAVRRATEGACRRVTGPAAVSKYVLVSPHMDSRAVKRRAAAAPEATAAPLPVEVRPDPEV